MYGLKKQIQRLIIFYTIIFGGEIITGNALLEWAISIFADVKYCSLKTIWSFFEAITLQGLNLGITKMKVINE